LHPGESLLANVPRLIAGSVPPGKEH
jgi:hypothetical protein